MAKHRSADWQVDLRPVTLTPKALVTPNSTQNGAAPHVEHSAKSDVAMLQTLSAVTAAVSELSRAVEAIGKRLDGLERSAAEQASNSQSLANELLTQAKTAAAAPARPVRSATRALRESTTAPLERRSRRAAATTPAAQPAAEAKDGAEQ